MEEAIKEDRMPAADHKPAPPDEVRKAIHEHCLRAQRRLRVLARESNDVLLAQALRSLRSAAALSAAPLDAGHWTQAHE